MAKNKPQKIKKQVEVNGKPTFENGKLKTVELKKTLPVKKGNKITETSVEKVGKMMDKHKFARDDLTETDKFIAKCKKEIAFCTIKLVKTSKPDEMESQILFRGKKICQICFSKVAYFSQYRFGATEKTIVKPTDEVMLLDCYEWVVSRVQEIEDDLDAKVKAKPVAKKPKKAKTTKTPEEMSEELKERVASCKSKGIHVADDIINAPFFKELAKAEHWNVDEKEHTIIVAQ